jgi:hypothetical protein
LLFCVCFFFFGRLVFSFFCFAFIFVSPFSFVFVSFFYLIFFCVFCFFGLSFAISQKTKGKKEKK